MWLFASKLDLDDSMVAVCLQVRQFDLSII